MPQGDKSSYTEKQKRQAEHIEESGEKRGMSKERAEQMAWATVNKQSGGGIKSGHGHAPTKADKSATAKSAAKSRETGTTSVERGETKTARSSHKPAKG
jgi:hypothetical protein